MKAPSNVYRAGESPRTRPVVSFAKKPSIRLIRRLIPVAARIAPQFTAERCLRLFLTPGRQSRPRWEAAHLENCRVEQSHLEGKRVTVYRWGNSSKKVLLCHAWGGRGTQLADFVPALVERGFEVVAFDAPGHGDSEGDQTDMVEYAKVVAELARGLGPLRAIVGHSFGAGNVVYAMHRYGVAAERVVLLGCFSDGEWVIDRFGELLNIPTNTVSRMKSTHEKMHGGDIRWSRNFKIAEMAGSDPTPTLIVHDRNDFEIPYMHAQALVDAGSGKHRLLSTDNLGHRRIVRDSAVVRSVYEFIVE